MGSADYNYDLSQRRANSVIQYLATKYNVPAHKIYVIGLGKDKPVESNKTSTGRADNRRVDVRLMTNTVGDSTKPALHQPRQAKTSVIDVTKSLPSSPEDFANQAAQCLPLSGLLFFQSDWPLGLSLSAE